MPAAKGLVERAHLTLQDRLVQELRLEGISSIEAANAYMPPMSPPTMRCSPKYRARLTTRIGQCEDEDLDLIFTWREQRKVTSNLTLHYELKLYLLPNTPGRL
jgi:hypothetical protein